MSIWVSWEEKAARFALQLSIFFSNNNCIIFFVWSSENSILSFDLESDVPELVPSVSDLNVDSSYFADLTNIL